PVTLASFRAASFGAAADPLGRVEYHDGLPDVHGDPAVVPLLARLRLDLDGIGTVGVDELHRRTLARRDLYIVLRPELHADAGLRRTFVLHKYLRHRRSFRLLLAAGGESDGQDGDGEKKCAEHARNLREF